MTNQHRGSNALEELSALLDSDPAMKAEYERLGPRYSVISSIIRARKAAGITQAELAERMGVTRPVLTRLESGRHDPRLEMIQRAANALGEKIVLIFTPTTSATTVVRQRPARTSMRPQRTARTR